MSTLMVTTEVDEEWVNLIAHARKLGITTDEIRRFFHFCADFKEEPEYLVENHTASQPTGLCPVFFSERTQKV